MIDLFSNPKMREAVPGSASVSSNPSVFSIGQHMENSVVKPTTVDKGKIRQDMNTMRVRFNKMSTADPRNRSNKPWKPEVTPPRRRGGFNRGRGGRQFDNSQRNDKSITNDSNNGQNGNSGQRNGNGTFRNRGQGQGNFRGTFCSRGRG